MQLRPMADLPQVLSDAGAEWEIILREDLCRGVVEPHTTQSLAQMLGVKESTILPFLRWADGEQPLRHVATPRFEGWWNEAQPPPKLLCSRPGPITLYRGELLPTLEWPRSPSRTLEVSSAPTAEYRYNEADEWTSVFAARERLQFVRPALNQWRETSWARLVTGVVAQFRAQPAAWADVVSLLSARILLQGEKEPAIGPEPLVQELAGAFATEAELLQALPAERREAGQKGWLANRLGASTMLTLADLRAMAEAWDSGEPGRQWFDRYEAACRLTSYPELALDSLRQRAIDWWQANPEADLSQALGGAAESAVRRRIEEENDYSGY